MSSKTKIIVLHMKEVVYTILFLILAIIFGVLLFFMFGSGKNQVQSGKAPKYTPGIYRSSISLNGNTFDMEVSLDSDRITAIDLVNLSESTQAAFPLMKPALESLAAQIYQSQSLENITYPDDQKYTSQLLLSSIKKAIEKGTVY
nr:hypothetical protein [uncultured Blautia sp.]